MSRLSSYRFEVAAKNAILDYLRHVEPDLNYNIEDISTVWFAHVLGNKKAIMIDSGNNNRLYEVTYNFLKNELYLDVYNKERNIVVEDINTTVVDI